MDEGERWFYAEAGANAAAGERTGPVTEAELRRRLVCAEIPADVLVWAPGLEEWMPADQVLDFEVGAVEPPPVPPSLPPVLPGPPAASRPPHDPDAAPQIRPWVRYWARMLDLSLYTLVVDWLVRPLGNPFDPTNPDYGFLAATLFLVVLLEAVVVAVSGTTPGKALLRVRLRRWDGGRLTMADSLQRAVRLFVVGEGLFIPFVTIACMAFSFQRLMGRGVTWWDEAGRVRVEHGHVGPIRTLLVVLLIAGITWWTVDWSQFS